MSIDDFDNLFNLEGKRAVVSGGSRGIGKMIAEGLVRAGVEVTISARKAEACDETAAELSQLGICHSVPADLTNPDGVAALVESLGGSSLDILVNNAGATWGEPIDDFPDAAFDKVLDINVKAVFSLTQALLPNLRAAGSSEDPARVINIGSIDGIKVPVLESFSYSASKAAVHQLTRHLASRLGREHITVNAIAPGPFESKMMAFALNDPDTRAGIERGIPLGRIGSPEDVAGTTIFLASRAGAYLTGAIIPVDGGITTQ
ncbi:MAG: SDR family oxidoreductase [Acidobacteria bacterium]|nr:SDR family oxidoreductase [Acidobacteriota bacterium]